MEDNNYFSQFAMENKNKKIVYVTGAKNGHKMTFQTDKLDPTLFLKK